ncbi:phospholipase A [Marinobacter sp. X15-166B]|uniref:phospholipase A n=1 Tax=Marinobacter sp. X15-166B TaxID=1897620 RepID=UPI00085C953B|nr:phospholipase A [Marinobacter sp. X15-166B]OEY66184.1 phospholipase [Marinobacter sp. X15-166B]
MMVSSPLLTALTLAVALLVLTHPALAGESPPVVTVDECALIGNGVKRLACFDAVVNTRERVNQASEQEIEAVEQRTTLLAPARDGDGGEVIAGTGIAEALVSRHLATEKAFMSFAGGFLPYKQSYLLPYTRSFRPNQTPSTPTLGDTDYKYGVDEDEAKFQISFKLPLLTGLFDDKTTLWFGYTQLSFWQLYNTAESAPFRETNYEPEIFARYDAGLNIGPGRIDTVAIGFNHQSNGRTEPQSRSWNRITGTLVYGVDNWLFMVSPWYRLPEGSDDNNPDIDRYLGYGDFLAVYKIDEDQSASLKLRNNLRHSDNKTSLEIGYSFPIGDTLKGYVQYFNGYGESLVDYNHRSHRLGFGIMLHDWL